MPEPLPPARGSAIQLKALDEAGGQALFRQGKEWFHVAVEGGWIPRSIEQGIALRAILRGNFFAAAETYESVDALVDAVRERWASVVSVPEVELEEVLHLFSPEVRAAHARAQEFVRDLEARSALQSKRTRESRKKRRQREGRSRSSFPWPSWPSPPWRWEWPWRPWEWYWRFERRWPEWADPPSAARAYVEAFRSHDSHGPDWTEDSFWGWTLALAMKEFALCLPRAQVADIENLASTAISILLIRGPARLRLPEPHDNESGFWGDWIKLTTEIVQGVAINSVRFERYSKRGGGRIDLSLDAEEAEFAETLSDKGIGSTEQQLHTIELREALNTAAGHLSDADAAMVAQFLETGDTPRESEGGQVSRRWFEVVRRLMLVVTGMGLDRGDLLRD